jgi:hypothetical protein
MAVLATHTKEALLEQATIQERMEFLFHIFGKRCLGSVGFDELQEGEQIFTNDFVKDGAFGTSPAVTWLSGAAT